MDGQGDKRTAGSDPEDDSRRGKVARLSSPHSPLTPLPRTVPTDITDHRLVEEINQKLKSIREGSEADPELTVSKYLGHWLRVAARKNKEEIFHILLRYSELDVNEVDHKMTTALMLACHSGSEELVKAILKNPRFDVTLRDRTGHSCLHYAVKSKKLQVVELLLADGRIDINVPNISGVTAFMMACIDGSLQIMQRLLRCQDQNLDVNCADKNGGDTPLLHAVVGGFEAIVSELLVTPGIALNKPNDNGDTALMCAANDGHDEIVRQLLERPEVEVNASNVDKYTSLMCACDKGNTRAVQLLLEHPKIDINLKVRLFSPFHIYC